MLFSPVSFYFFNVATGKFQITCMALICGLRYISIGWHCFTPFHGEKKIKTSSVSGF